MTPTYQLFYCFVNKYLSTKLLFRNLAFSMRMGDRTIAKIVHETCLAIREELVSDFMPVPTQEKLASVTMDYYNS